MPSKLTLSLVSVALGLGIGGATGASIDPAQRAKGPDVTSAMVPAQGNFRSGFDAIKTDERHNLKADSSTQGLAPIHGSAAGLARPEGIWADGLTALPSAFSHATSTDEQRALSTPPGALSSSNGLAALKSSVRSPTDKEMQNLRSQVAGPPATTSLSRPSK
jgi:hypothetical protein